MPVPRRTSQGSALARAALEHVPALVAAAGEDTAKRFLEFFTANIRNHNTRAAYARAVGRFLAWAEEQELSLHEVEPLAVAAYVELLQKTYSPPTVKQNLAAIRMLFDWLVTGGLLKVNPAASVRGPKHVVKTGKTPVLDADQARTFLDSIPLKNKDGSPNLVGLRDRALIGLMVYSFARVGAAVSMRAEDYFQDGKRWSFRLHEKGGTLHKVPAHHNAEAYVDEYLEAAGIRDAKKAPLFQTVSRARALIGEAMTRVDVYRMIRRRSTAAELPAGVGCHTFRATGITVSVTRCTSGEIVTAFL